VPQTTREKLTILGWLTPSISGVHCRLATYQSELAEAFELLVDFLKAPCEELDLPLDIRGSFIEQEVRRALRSVSSGQTVTYDQITRSLPLPATT
jgi:O6-methylguanine-DNA--protein-cysteine methyltransferase